jgi:hypothetical protein
MRIDEKDAVGPERPQSAAGQCRVGALQHFATGLRTRGGAGLQLFLEVGVRSGSDT